MFSTKYLYGLSFATLFIWSAIWHQSIICLNTAAQQTTPKLRNLKQQLFIFTHMSLTQVRPMWTQHQAVEWVHVCSTCLSSSLEQQDPGTCSFHGSRRRAKDKLNHKHIPCFCSCHVSLVRWLSPKQGPHSNHHQTKANHMTKLHIKRVRQYTPTGIEEGQWSKI